MQRTNGEIRKAVELMDLSTEMKIKKLSVNERSIFNDMFRKHLRSKTIAIILAFLSLHYLYIDITRPINWILQALYYATCGGFLIWLFADIIRMDSILGNMYDQKAEIILNKIKI